MKHVDAFVDAVVRHAGISLGIILVVTAVMGYAFAHQKHNNHIDIFFEPGDPRMEAYKQFQKTFGNEEFTVVALEADRLFANEKLAVIRELTAELEQVAGVDRVVSITNVEEFHGTQDTIMLRPVVPDGHLSAEMLEAVRKRALTNHFVQDHLISADGRMTALIVELESMKAKAKRRTMEAILSTAEARAERHFKLYCSGPSFMEVELNRLSEVDFLTFIPVVVVVLFVLIVILFRQLSLALLCQANLLIVLVWGMGFYVFCGERFNIITNAMGAVLLAIAIADSVHIMSHLKNMYRHTEIETLSAIKKTLRQVWFPCLFTSLTTGAGFLSFYSSNIRPVAILGVFTAAGVMFAFIISVVTLPSLMVIFRNRITKALETFKTAKRFIAGRRDVFRDMLVLAGRIAVRRYRWFFGLFLVVMALSVAGIFQIRFETNTFEYLPDDNPIKADFKVIENHFGGTIPFVVRVKVKSGADFTHPQAVDKIARIQRQLLAEYPELTHAFSVVNYLKEFNRAINADQPAYDRVPDSRLDIMDAYELGDPEVLDRIITPDHREVCMTFLSKWNSNEAGYRLHAEANALMAGVFGDAYDFDITGLSSLYLTMDRHLQQSQIRSFFIAFVIIFFMMLFVCRNFGLAVLSMVPNLFPIILTIGIMGWFDIPLDVATTMIASVTIGIAVDDTIHFISWLRRNHAVEGDARQALIQTFADVGKPIAITTMLLFSGFLVLMLGSIIPTKMFGLLTALSMAFALIGDFFVLPPLVLIFKPNLPYLEKNPGMEG